MKRAWELAARAGFDPTRLQPVAGATHEVWVGDAIVVRIARHRHGSFAREVAIAQRLAPAALYPELLAAGDDWMVSRRAPGQQLGRAWRTLTTTERERAIGELAAALDALHATDTRGIPDDIAGPHAVTRETVLDTADRAALEQGNDQILVFEVRAFIRERWERAFDVPHDVLVHGDPHFENVLWDGTHVTALVDLEWSRRAWRECDLEILLAHASHPALFAAADYEATVEASAYRDIPTWLHRARPDWFAHPHVAERVALMFAARTLGALVDAPGHPIRHAHLRQIIGR